MKPEVGMYVRTKKGIAKIIDRILEPDHYYFKMWVTDKFLEINDDTEYISEVDVLKSSYNIIDLIEVEDYVNGSKVQEIRKNYIEIEEYSGLNNDEPCILKSEDIKSIVTKEQFEQMSYIIEKGDDK